MVHGEPVQIRAGGALKGKISRALAKQQKIAACRAENDHEEEGWKRVEEEKGEDER